jgi:hypothetical protein
VGAQAATEDGVDVVVGQAGVQQLAHHEGRTAGGLEVVHVGVAVRVDARQQRHDFRQLVEVGPVDHDAGGARDRDQVHGVVGRAAGRVQRGDGVDDALLVDDMADRHVLAALLRDGDGALGRGAGQARRAAACPG